MARYFERAVRFAAAGLAGVAAYYVTAFCGATPREALGAGIAIGLIAWFLLALP